MARLHKSKRRGFWKKNKSFRKTQGLRSKFQVGTLNTRCLGAASSKFDQDVKWMCFISIAEARNWDALCLTDVRWGESGFLRIKRATGNWLIVGSGKVAVALAPKVGDKWEQKNGKWEAGVDGRSIRVDLPGSGGKSAVSLIAVYAPDSKAPRAWREKCLEGLRLLKESAPQGTPLIMAGDWNAQVGARKDNEGSIGRHGHGLRSKTGNDLVRFAQEEGLAFPHSWFQQKNRDTWVSPAGVGYALDYFMVPSGDLNRVQRVRVIHDSAAKTWGLDPWKAYTDHSPVELTINLKHKFRNDKYTHPEQPAWERLRGQGSEAKGLRKDLQKKIEEDLSEGTDHFESWDHLCRVVQSSGVTVLGEKEPRINKPWLVGRGDEIKKLSTDTQEKYKAYRAVQKNQRPWTQNVAKEVEERKQTWKRADTQRKRCTRTWENEWWHMMAEKLETAELAHNTTDIFKIHRDMTSQATNKRRKTKPLVAGEVEAERAAWKEHFERVSSDVGKVSDEVWKNLPRVEKTEAWLGEVPTALELYEALRKMPLGKAAGEDQLHVEAIKYGGPKVQSFVFEVVQNMWALAVKATAGEEAQDWPEAWKRALVIPLWKGKGTREDKNNWRGITLLSVGTKLLARVVSDRAQRWSESFAGEHQTGFRKGRGTDDAHQVTRVIAEEAAQVQKEGVVISMYDIEKAYPRVCRPALWELMARLGACPRFVAVCRALHENTTIFVKVLSGVSEGYIMKRGLREGCPSSPPFSTFITTRL
jgi:hypothetical protein